MNIKNVEDIYPLSPMQQGMLFHSLAAPESGVYVEQLRCTLRGDLDVPAFERAWQRVTERHAVLRTAFVGEATKEPAQVVYRRVPLPLEQQDWRGISWAEQERQLEAWLRADRARGFELAKAPLMRLGLNRTGEDTHTFIWTHHHALLDGWSVPMLLQEVFLFYEGFRRGQEVEVERRGPYRDYIRWLKRQDLAKAESFWRRTLRGFRAPTPLVVDLPLGAADGREEQYAEEENRLPAGLTAALQALVRTHELTMNTLVQGAWALLLSRYSGEEDVVFGATVSGRPADLPGSESMIGLFINTLPVRVQVPPAVALLTWLKELQGQQVELREFEYSPLVQIQGWSEVPRGTPLFESILVFENYPVDIISHSQEGSLAIEDIVSVEQANYPLTVVAGAAQHLSLKIAYDGQRFEAAVIRRMLGHLQTLLESQANNPHQCLSQLPLLTEVEKQQLVVEWNANPAEYPQGRCAHELFEAQVERTPEATAVTLEGEALTYQALNRRANQLAHHLQELGVGPDTLVGICVERSLEMVVGLLGILKAGGAYLPLDPTYPPERLAFMLEDAQVPVLLIQDRLLHTRLAATVSVADLPQCTHPAYQGRVVRLDADWEKMAETAGADGSASAYTRESDENPTSGVAADNLAYVIYTSGSTGRPKGTLLHHRGLGNLVHALQAIFRIEPASRVLQFASLSFDASVAEIFPTLAAGATLCLAHPDVLASGPDLVQLLREQAITIVTLPPSMLAVLPAEGLPALRVVVSAGEQCSGQILTRWAPGRCFINGYGPTETTVAASYYIAEGATEAVVNVPIGRPIPNTRIYLLDPYLRPVPMGVPGEVHVGGVSLAQGYLHQPALTAARFIPDPFSDEPGARLYRTGDLARYLPDGNIQFLGRVDHQVKVRGFRIELEEIEAILSRHPAVRQAVALVREDVPGDRQLIAYVVPTGEPVPSTGELRDYLKEALPAYMIPTAYVFLDSLPLTPNGKVDRKALPAPDRTRPELERPLVAPRDALELQLARMWEEVLDIRPIGVQDNFYELGGQSLLALRLIARIQQRLGQNVSLATLLQEPTVEHLASVLRQEGRTPPSSLVPIRPGGARRPLFFVHPSGGSVHWYADLARYVDSDRPFYGLQAQGLYGDAALHTRIEEMAAHYVSVIRELQPEGPYLLGSWSMGVAVAFEMAQQFQAQGEQVALLAMLDQGPSLPAEEPEDDAAYLVEVFGSHVPLSLEHLRGLGPDEQVANVWEEARRVHWIYPDVTLAQFRHFVRVLRTHTEAWRRYVPRAYPGRITLLRASEQHPPAPQVADMGWGMLAAGGVEVYEVPGDHLSMIHEPHVQILAERLTACLDQVQAAD